MCIRDRSWTKVNTQESLPGGLYATGTPYTRDLEHVGRPGFQFDRATCLRGLHHGFRKLHQLQPVDPGGDRVSVFGDGMLEVFDIPGWECHKVGFIKNRIVYGFAGDPQFNLKTRPRSV